MQNKQIKRATIERLIVERAKRSDAAQIKELDARLGAGIGAKKERARLLKAQ